MIPPCDPSILEQNPQFKRLYEDITTSLLNPDGSTRAHPADPARRAVVDVRRDTAEQLAPRTGVTASNYAGTNGIRGQDLIQCQLRSAKRKIKEHTLKQLAFTSDSGLPDECRDILAITAIYLETPRVAIDPDTPQDGQSQPDVPDDALTLLAPSISSFYTHIPALITPFATLISDTLTTLRILSATPDTDTAQKIHPPPTTNHQSRARARNRRVRTSLAPAPPLAAQLRTRVDALRTTQLSELPAARRDMAATAAKLMGVRTVVLERMVVVLERVKHGALARAVRARAEHLAVVAQGIEGKVEVAKLEIAASLYTPETLAALERYRAHLRDTRSQIEELRSIALEELNRYGDVDTFAEGIERVSHGDGGTLAEIARRYGGLVREVENVRMEIARLGE